MLCFCSVFCQKLLRKSSVLFFFGSVFIIGDTATVVIVTAVIVTFLTVGIVTVVIVTVVIDSSK